MVPTRNGCTTTLWYYGGYTLYNPVTGLMLDVQGDSYWGGAEIDTWYPTGHPPARSTRSSTFRSEMRSIPRGRPRLTARAR